MNVAVQAVPRTSSAAAPPARLALLGTGNVGGEVLARLEQLGRVPGGGWSLVHVRNSRACISDRAGLRPTDAGERVRGQAIAAGALPEVPEALGHDGLRIIIDATASDAIAARHAEWLAAGIHVVTACKLGQGTSLERWRSIRAAADRGGAVYGDAATVGAGLPLIRSIRELVAGGDRILGIAGVLSGSLAWLFNHYDGLRPFSGFVRQARHAGYTEPDPREDLSGEDVRRKILILARSAGHELEEHDVRVESLVPQALARLAQGEVDASLAMLDGDMRARFADARKSGCSLRFVARLDQSCARVGLEALAADDPLAAGAGTDNRLAIEADRYRGQPLVIQGPGAGAAVTAAALVDDMLRIIRGPASHH
ncbi:hypothetical protein [Novilysobacter spongiicola]|uniref:Homoserine dehydrogenase n=1 Tax=Lysobacter spongiicola DSM 21749 TaxID=1122188 RepID=A0A1T4RDD1_9GAMM|nr:hypothetical protein [Lysobacter spongiicola]SKA13796.1 homoserine dehydrogenase [Lysobacter spongiicola DSM 21749]